MPLLTWLMRCHCSEALRMSSSANVLLPAPGGPTKISTTASGLPFSFAASFISAEARAATERSPSVCSAPSSGSDLPNKQALATAVQWHRTTCRDMQAYCMQDCHHRHLTLPCNKASFIIAASFHVTSRSISAHDNDCTLGWIRC